MRRITCLLLLLGAIAAQGCGSNTEVKSEPNVDPQVSNPYIGTPQSTMETDENEKKK